MPRCQWCRQESQNPDVCDWCKRPLSAGWTPSAAAAPADKMTFAPGDEPQNDRLLMFSVVGIVVVTALAVGISLLNRKNLPAIQPAAPPIVQPAPTPSPTVVDSQPSQTQSTASQQDPQQQYSQQDVEQPEIYQAPPAAQPQPYRATGQNRKLDGSRDMTVIN